MSPPIDTGALEDELQQLRDLRLTREDVDTLLDELGQRIGIEALKLNPQGVADLVFHDQLPLSLVYLEHLSGVVAAVPLTQLDADDPVALTQLLQANMNWAQTQGGSFGMIPGHPEPMLLRLFVPRPGDAQRLEQQLAAFVQLATQWRDKPGTDAEPGATPPDLAPPTGGIRV